VKTYRGCPLNEETDIRAEMGRMKEENKKTWKESTNPERGRELMTTDLSCHTGKDQSH
jgi:hypothetical protein